MNIISRREMQLDLFPNFKLTVTKDEVCLDDSRSEISKLSKLFYRLAKTSFYECSIPLCNTVIIIIIIIIIIITFI